MPEGLQYALSEKLSREGPRISVISYDAGPSLFLQSYLDEILENCGNHNSKGSDGGIQVHFMKFTSGDATISGLGGDHIITYDFTRNPCECLEILSQTLEKNVNGKPGRSHALIIDDFSIFAILTCGRSLQMLSRFLLVTSRQFDKMYLFTNKDTLSSEEIAVLYDRATDIAYLRTHPECINEISGSKNKFTCDLLKIRNDRRATHEKTIFQIGNGEIKEERATDQNLKGESSEADLLKNLTTFKLTLEDGERETKNKLHLPYFEAQKTSLEDPDEIFDDDFDEEDEEV